MIAGKYAQDFGVIDETCYPYQGHDTQTCSHKTCQRTYVAKYEYIGGYYGASTEENMMEALVANGPIAVGIMVRFSIVLILILQYQVYQKPRQIIKNREIKAIRFFCHKQNWQIIS